MTLRRVAELSLVAILLFCMYRPQTAIPDEVTAPLIPTIEDPTADLPVMMRRHTIRILVNYSKTNFFLMGAKPCGYEYELLQQYGKFLNQGMGKTEKQTEIVFIPVTFERLLPALLEGEGDIAAAGLTITSERQELVAFTDPYLPSVNEIVVTSGKIKELKHIEDLSGRTVYVARASSYVQHVREINQRLESEGSPPIKIVEASKSLEMEDILELVNARVFDLTISDHHIAELWSSVLPNLILRHDLTIHTGGQIARTAGEPECFHQTDQEGNPNGEYTVQAIFPRTTMHQKPSGSKGTPEAR
jgi:membrane-bound lytic murein transglycosylase MltF